MEVYWHAATDKSLSIDPELIESRFSYSFVLSHHNSTSIMCYVKHDSGWLLS